MSENEYIPVSNFSVGDSIRISTELLDLIDGLPDHRSEVVVVREILQARDGVKIIYLGFMRAIADTGGQGP